MSPQQRAKVGTNFWARERAPIRLVEQSRTYYLEYYRVHSTPQRGSVVDEEVCSWQANSFLQS